MNIFSKKSLFLFIILVGFGTLFSLVMNPYRIFSFPISLECPLHYNGPLRKAELLESAAGVQALVLGGDSSQVFLSQEIEKILGQKTFHGGLAGTPASSHYVLAEQGLRTQASLKDVFYFVRFDEFLQHPFFPEDILVLGNQKLREMLPMATTATAEKISQEGRLLKFLSPKHFFASFPQVLQCLGLPLGAPFSKAGTPKLLAQVSARGENKSFAHFSQPDIQIDKKLAVKIQNSVDQFRKVSMGLLGGHLETKAFYRQLVTAAETKGVRLHLVLLPFHPHMYRALKEDTAGGLGADFDESYFGWIQYSKNFHKPPHIWVHDQTNSDRIFSPTSMFWKDGVSINSRGASHILADIRKELSNLKSVPKGR